MTNKPDVTLMTLVVGMFISLLICICTMGYFAYKVTSVDYKYELIQEDYTRKIEMQNREYETRYNRLQEQMSTLQFTSDKRDRLFQEQLQMYRNEIRNEKRE